MGRKGHDQRRTAITRALDVLSNDQIQRIIDTAHGKMVCDIYAYDAATGHY